MPTLTTDTSLFTYQDAIERLTDYVGGNALAGTVRAVKQSVLEAYDDVVNAWNWRYLKKLHRIPTVAPEEGTLSYSSSTGVFTIDSGAWPSWAELAFVKVGEVVSLIKTRTSNTELIADTYLRPIADITTGTSFTIYKAIFPLPFDFRGAGRLLDEGEGSWTEYADLADWLELTRYGTETGAAIANSFAAHPYDAGRYVAMLAPGPDTAQSIDFPYQRFPRRLIYNGMDSPCRDGSASSSGATVTGSSSAFESGMEGAIFRWGRTTTTHPDGIGGLNAYKQQIYVLSVTNATTLTLAESPASSISSSTKYTISDPIDLDRTMQDAFWRCCEFKLSQRLKLPSLDRAEVDYRRALDKAKGADGKSTALRTAWGWRPRSWRDTARQGENPA